MGGAKETYVCVHPFVQIIALQALNLRGLGTKAGMKERRVLGFTGSLLGFFLGPAFPSAVHPVQFIHVLGYDMLVGAGTVSVPGVLGSTLQGAIFFLSVYLFFK